MFKDPDGVSRTVASPTAQDDLPEQLISSIKGLRADAALALDGWLGELLTGALSRSDDDDVRGVLVAADTGQLQGPAERAAQEVLVVVRSRLDDLQTSIETLESCQDLLDPD